MCIRDRSEAYAYFANGGHGIKPYLIEQVRKRDNEIVYVENPVRVCSNPCDYVSMDTLQFPFAESVEEISELRKKAGLPRFSSQTIDPRNIYQMVSMLKDVVKYGTAKKAKVLKRSDLAGKTGTTNDQKDAWFSGFNREIVTVSFLGFDNHSSLGKKEFGSTAAAVLPNSFFPNEEWLSKPRKLTVTISLLKPLNQASFWSFVVPVLPAKSDLFKTFAFFAVPYFTTSFNMLTI